MFCVEFRCLPWGHHKFEVPRVLCRSIRWSLSVGQCGPLNELPFVLSPKGEFSRLTLSALSLWAPLCDLQLTQAFQSYDLCGQNVLRLCPPPPGDATNCALLRELQRGFFPHIAMQRQWVVHQDLFNDAVNISDV
jgi:hypothetical protein